MYFVKTPFWLKRIFKNYTWNIETPLPQLYLTFDDGPHPVITSYVLNELDKYNAKATFFCIGKNVLLYPHIYDDILKRGHTVGNHTHNHLNGWKTPLNLYMENISMAMESIDSKLFRPPYGRITGKQGRALLDKGFKVMMWEVLSGDFDRNISPQKCLSNVISKAKNGSIIVFHDSEKAFENLKYALPATLEYFSNKGYAFESITI